MTELVDMLIIVADLAVQRQALLVSDRPVGYHASRDLSSRESRARQETWAKQGAETLGLKTRRSASVTPRCAAISTRVARASGAHSCNRSREFGTERKTCIHTPKTVSSWVVHVPCLGSMPVWINAGGTRTTSADGQRRGPFSKHDGGRKRQVRHHPPRLPMAAALNQALAPAKHSTRETIRDCK